MFGLQKDGKTCRGYFDTTHLADSRKRIDKEKTKMH